MPSTRLARPEEHEQIHLLGYDTWGDGAELGEYLEECRTSSKYARGRWFVLPDTKGRVVSALLVSVLGEGVAGVGSVATMPSLRRRGFAAQLLRDVLERIVDEGFSTVFLFADVDPRIYESVGFQALPERFQQREGSTLMSWGPGADAVVSSAGFVPPEYF